MGNSDCFQGTRTCWGVTHCGVIYSNITTIMAASYMLNISCQIGKSLDGATVTRCYMNSLIILYRSPKEARSSHQINDLDGSLASYQVAPLQNGDSFIKVETSAPVILLEYVVRIIWWNKWSTDAVMCYFVDTYLKERILILIVHKGSEMDYVKKTLYWTNDIILTLLARAC